MDSYLLDTNVASWLLDAGDKKHQGALNFVKGVGGDDLIYLSRVTIAEIEYGYKINPNVDKARKKVIDQRIALFQLREINRHTTEPYSEIRAALFRQFAPRNKRNLPKSKRSESLIDRTTGKELGIQENDIWIAAIAVQYNLVLVTQDEMRNIQQVLKKIHPKFQFISLPI